MVLSEPETEKLSSSTSLRASSSGGNSSGRKAAGAAGRSGAPPSTPTPSTGASSAGNKNKGHRRNNKKKTKPKRRKTESERRVDEIRQSREAQYTQARKNSSPGSMSIFSFESLFPAAVWDDEAVYRDLYEVSERDGKQFLTELKGRENGGGVKGDDAPGSSPRPDSFVGKQLEKVQRSNGSRLLRKEPKANEGPSSAINNITNKSKSGGITSRQSGIASCPKQGDSADQTISKNKSTAGGTNTTKAASGRSEKEVDVVMTRMVEDKVYGFRRSPAGDFEYDTSLMGDGAVQFRDGVRLGRSLKVNCDRLNYHAKKELSRGRLEEAREMYEGAIELDPMDGRAYLGLSRIAQRRRDFPYARKCLRAGIANSVNQVKEGPDGSVVGDFGANPFLLQALGCLEERVGNLAEAEALFVEAAKSRPSHAAAWVSLAQLRTRKLRQGASAGRVCYQTAERQLRLAGRKPSSHVYTAWAALEYKKAGDVRRARELFNLALECDPKCSAAWLQLGVMEADKENWDRAQECFETVLKFDRNNSRVLQAYALMESKRPDGNSREVIDLFERALKANSRDAGVLQAYALYVSKLGDIDAARDLLRRGVDVNKRHAPVWQAWGVLETRYGTADEARDIFQQGIWACAQSGGGQSGGRRCARLWQAWGVLEAREENYAAARRCFSRALDADNRNVAAVTAWTLMEEDLGNVIDARSIFERVLKQFPSSSDDKLAIWRAYELMEQRSGNLKASQQVYQRSMRESMAVSDVVIPDGPDVVVQRKLDPPPDMKTLLKKSNEVEVSRWGSANDSMDGEVWLNNGSIEGRVPSSAMKKRKKARNPDRRKQ